MSKASEDVLETPPTAKDRVSAPSLRDAQRVLSKMNKNNQKRQALAFAEQDEPYKGRVKDMTLEDLRKHQPEREMDALLEFRKKRSTDKEICSSQKVKGLPDVTQPMAYVFPPNCTEIVDGSFVSKPGNLSDFDSYVYFDTFWHLLHLENIDGERVPVVDTVHHDDVRNRDKDGWVDNSFVFRSPTKKGHYIQIDGHQKKHCKAWPGDGGGAPGSLFDLSAVEVIDIVRELAVQSPLSDALDGEVNKGTTVMNAQSFNGDLILDHAYKAYFGWQVHVYPQIVAKPSKSRNARKSGKSAKRERKGKSDLEHDASTKKAKK